MSRSMSALAASQHAPFRVSPDPRGAVLDFLEEAYQAGAKCATWDTKQFQLSRVA
ncbi:hypothetical protein BH20ACI2_BH20ACI2_23580 [soil metagenome]